MTKSQRTIGCSKNDPEAYLVCVAVCISSSDEDLKRLSRQSNLELIVDRGGDKFRRSEAEGKEGVTVFLRICGLYLQRDLEQESEG